MRTTTAAYLRRSQFIAGLAKACRGLRRDIRVLVWLVKRKGQIADYLKANRVRKLQIGTSNNVLDGWLNTDIFPLHGSVVYLDASGRFPFEDDTFDFIISEHMIEHIDYQAALAMLRECFRVLKPGGRARFATPDLDVLLALHSDEQTGPQLNYIDWAIAKFAPDVRECREVFVINNFFRAWGHTFLYDADALRLVLSTAGFRGIKFFKPGVSEDPTLEKIESHGRELGNEDVNQFETIVAEGFKGN